MVESLLIHSGGPIYTQLNAVFHWIHQTSNEFILTIYVGQNIPEFEYQ